MSKNFLFNECSASASASINFPSKIEVTEKKAPTDQSIELLEEMEQKALHNIIAKVSSCENNKFSWEAYFSQLASLSFEPMGLLTLRIKLNGQIYVRTIKLRTTMMNQIHECIEEFGTASLQSSQVNMAIRRLLIFELGVVIAETMFNGNGCDISEVHNILMSMSDLGLTNFDVRKVEENIQNV